MTDKPDRRHHRVNLHIHARTADGHLVNHVLHIGFFPAGAARVIAELIDARGIAFAANPFRATGRVSVAIAAPDRTDPSGYGASREVRTLDYGLPGSTRAQQIAAKWVARLGRGFHPDTRGADYDPPLSLVEVLEYDADIGDLFTLSGDPYQIALVEMLRQFPEKES